MKKVMSLVLAALMVAAMLCACTSSNGTTGAPAGTTTAAPAPDNTTAAPAPDNTTAAPTPDNTTAAPVAEGPVEVNVSDYFGDESKWEDDGGYFDMDAEKLFFDNFAAGDYAAVRLTEEYQNVTYKFNITINQLAPVSMDDYTWWDSELCVIARSTIAGNSWQDDGSQKGYTLTSWGDMNEVCIGRCGYDDAFGTFQWNIGDGQPHAIEFTVVNNADGTVTITLVVDGAEIASVVDDGSLVKNERPSLYPDAGGLTIRCKWLEATIE